MPSFTAVLPGRNEMAIFVTQGRFTREYIGSGLAKPEDRQAAISRLCEQAGGKLLNFHFTLGQHDSCWSRRCRMPEPPR
jgi:uncharacterized protein with GYD domain